MTIMSILIQRQNGEISYDEALDALLAGGGLTHLGASGLLQDPTAAIQSYRNIASKTVSLGRKLSAHKPSLASSVNDLQFAIWESELGDQ
jgi:hypothetical protein